MPLSEHEQRLLEQIERALVAEDPKFASRYSQAGRGRRVRRGLVLAVLGFVAGLGLLIAGVHAALIPLGALGFVLMLAGAGFAVSQWTGARRSPAPAAPAAADTRRASVRDRMEERWRRRWEDRH